MSAESKTCTKCGETKTLDMFWGSDRGKYKKQAVCSSCLRKERNVYEHGSRGQRIARTQEQNMVVKYGEAVASILKDFPEC